MINVLSALHASKRSKKLASEPAGFIVKVKRRRQAPPKQPVRQAGQRNQRAEQRGDE